MHAHPGAWLLGLCLLGCVVRPPADGDTGDTTDASTSGGPATDPTASPTTSAGSTSADATSDATSDATTDAPTTDATTTDAPTTDATTGDESTGGPPTCGPDMPSNFKFTLDPAPDEFIDLLFDWSCDVLGVAVIPDGLSLSLACTADGVPVDPMQLLTISGTPPIPPTAAIAQVDALHLRYEQFAPWWTERYIRVDGPDDTLLLAGVVSSGDLDVFAGVGITTLAPPCAPHDDGCGLVDEDRLGITIDGAMGEVDSRGFAEIGAHGVWAPRVTTYVDGPQCTDTPDRWIVLDVVRLTP